MALDIQMLSSLQRVVPVLLRHLDAYLELAGQDWEQTKLNMKRKAQLTALMAVSGWFALLMICTLVVALTWDTPNRVLAIGIMAALFVAITAGAAAYIARGKDRPMANLRREWHADRDLMREYLSGGAQTPRQHPDMASSARSSAYDTHRSTASNASAQTGPQASRDGTASPNKPSTNTGDVRYASPSSMRPATTRPLTH